MDLPPLTQAFVLPMILAYTILTWRVFGGKATGLRYD